MAHKHHVVSSRMVGHQQVVGKSLADFIRQWESVVAPPLPAYDDFSGIPVEVI